MLAFAPCKINIGLDIVAKRPDGYHDIVTAMVPVPWHDIVEAVPAAGPQSTLTVLGRKVDCPVEKNLVMRALRAMQERYGVPDVDLTLQKIVPDGAGLGGGSSDASTTLLILNDLFELNRSKEELAEVAASLGADCPFFIYNRPMLCTGTGTEMRPVDIDLSGFTLLIAKPQGVCVSTKEAYAGVKPAAPDMPLDELLRLPASQWQGRVKNDFEASIFPIAPQCAA
ncbi:MAG: 4-(cytidine 5'-diphospho)-2-C-methyl-D-erythritol kinase, partial [Muribaculaceae bacterium]|nr:4-(cytidine 5'-diphospho)-2-C-methyl-D-erythritol kinase [Muribaculaceae bacterium]